MRKKKLDNNNVVNINDHRRKKRKRRLKVDRSVLHRAKSGRRDAKIKALKQSRASSRSAAFVAGLFFIFVLVYLVRTLIDFLNTPEIPVEMVRMGSVEAPMLIEGIIIRDETLYPAPRAGTLQYYVNPHDRVRPGTVVGSIQNVEAVAGIRQDMARSEEELMRLHDMRGSISVVDPAVRLINGRVTDMINQRISRHIHLNMHEVYTLRDAINHNLNIRNQMIINDNQHVRAELEVGQLMLQGQLDANRTPIRVSRGGIVSTIIDGFESQLTFENMRYLTREQTRQNVDFDRVIPRRELEEGEAAFKIINSNIWYIAAYIPNELTENFVNGQWRNIYIEGRSVPLSVQVHRMEPGFQETFVLFRATRYMLDFLDTRSLFFRTTGHVQHGIRVTGTAITTRMYLRVPIEAVHGPEDEPYVIKVREGESLALHLMYADESGGFMYIPYNPEFLQRGDILRDRLDASALHVLSETAEVQGVYRVIDGIASFRRVHVPEDAGGLYVILDPALNPGLRPHDHIVTHAEQAAEGQIVFGGIR